MLRVGSVACVACGGIRASLVDRPIKTGDRQTEYKEHKSSTHVHHFHTSLCDEIKVACLIVCLFV